jgi:hypothetical protein
MGYTAFLNLRREHFQEEAGLAFVTVVLTSSLPHMIELAKTDVWSH